MMQVVENKMEAQQFCYWLQGFAELNNGVPPNEMQWKAIRDHLALVFEKKTPPYNVPLPRSPNPNDTLGPNLNLPPVWYGPKTTNPDPNYLQPPYTVTCSSGTTCNNSIASIC